MAYYSLIILRYYPSSVEGEITFSPCKYLLHQNYPNPFNPTTTIQFQIPELSFVTLKVYDVLGNEVAILVNGEKSAGSYVVEFDGSELSTGIYYYQLKSSGFIQTRKMLLLR